MVTCAVDHASEISCDEGCSLTTVSRKRSISSSSVSDWGSGCVAGVCTPGLMDCPPDTPVSSPEDWLLWSNRINSSSLAVCPTLLHENMVTIFRTPTSRRVQCSRKMCVVGRFLWYYLRLCARSGRGTATNPVECASEPNGPERQIGRWHNHFPSTQPDER